LTTFRQPTTKPVELAKLCFAVREVSKVENASFLRQHHSEEISAGFRWVVIGADRPTPSSHRTGLQSSAHIEGINR
jgi:hypothetical protein